MVDAPRTNDGNTDAQARGEVECLGDSEVGVGGAVMADHDGSRLHSRACYLAEVRGVDDVAHGVSLSVVPRVAGRSVLWQGRRSRDFRPCLESAPDGRVQCWNTSMPRSGKR